jgi:replicative DNA helicase
MTLKSINEYGAGFQIKVLAALLNHKSFLTNIYDIISDEYFESQAHKWIIKEILKYYSKYHTTPSLEVLKVELKKVQNEVLQISIKDQLREAYKESDDLAYVEEEFSTFCKNQMLKKALLQSVDLLQAGDYDSIKFMIEAAMKAGQDKNIGHEYNKDLESRYREEHRTIVPTPWEVFNELLQGGWVNGDFAW